MKDIIYDSMCYDSGTFISEYKEGNRWAYVAVQGEVRVYYKDEGTPYKYASRFPDELMEMFKTGKYDYDKMNVVDNNWFEIFWGEDGKILDSDVFDVPTPISKKELDKHLKNYFKEYFDDRDRGDKVCKK